MTVNMGMIDRAARLVLGVVLIALALFNGMSWGWVGVVPLLTAIVGFCPLYTLIGLNTCGRKSGD